MREGCTKEEEAYSNLTVLAFLSTMERPIIAELTDIICLIVPSMADGASCQEDQIVSMDTYLDTESGTVLPSNLLCSSGMAWTERTCRSGKAG